MCELKVFMNLKVSYKTQIGLAFIPFFGIIVMILTSFANIKVKKGAEWGVLYFLSNIIPVFTLMGIGALLYKLLVDNLSLETQYALITTLACIIMYIIFLCIAIVAFFLEKAFIRYIEKKQKEDLL